MKKEGQRKKFPHAFWSSSLESVFNKTEQQFNHFRRVITYEDTTTTEIKIKKGTETQKITTQCKWRNSTSLQVFCLWYMSYTFY